jgi:cyanophycinase
MATGKGVIALVGSGEFLPGADRLDQALLASLEGPARVAILPTASAPDGPGVPERWAKMGVEHFQRLGAGAEAVMLLTRQDAGSAELAERIASANFVYLSGGKPGYLVQTLQNTACWRAIRQVFEQGGVVAGCSAGAMALAGSLPGFLRSQPALGLAPGIAVIPHFDEIPGWLSGLGRFATRGVTVVGVEGSTGLVGAGPNWRVAGRGRVTVFNGGAKKRYTAGATVTLF